MKRKGILGTLVFILLMGSNLNAQDSTATDDCGKYRSLYYQYLKQNMFNDAADFWTKAYNSCGSAGVDAKFFSNGRYIYTKLMKEDGVDSVRAKRLDDSLNWIFEQRMAIEKDYEWMADYASKLVSDDSQDFEKIDKLFGEAIPALKENAKSTHVKQYFKHLIVNKFNGAKAEEKEDARTLVVEEYMVLTEYVSMATKAAAAKDDKDEVQRQESAQNFLDKYFLIIAKDCDVLVGVFDKKLNSLPQNPEEKKKKVNRYLELMDQKKCQTSEVYGKLVDTLIALEPTAEAYFFGGSYALNNDNVSKAGDYFEKAVELEGEGANKDKYLLNLANVQYKQRAYSTAFRTAKNVNDNEYKGDALMICANSIAATANSCGESTFARKANYWLANDYVNRAIAAGKSGVSSGQFLSNAPDSNEAFSEGISAGSSFTLSCWGESTTVRF